MIIMIPNISVNDSDGLDRYTVRLDVILQQINSLIQIIGVIITEHCSINNG